MSLPRRLEQKLRAAIRQFWVTRESQARKQGTRTGAKDAGARAAVTGGAQMHGFVRLIRDILREQGLPGAHVYCEKSLELPGWYRPEKKWDLLIVVDGRLIAGIEFKSQVGSFGNNFNNRAEEAIGSAADLWAAYREELERLRAIPKGSGGNFYWTQAARVSKRFARALVASTLEGQTLHRDAFRLLGFSKLATFQELGHSLGVV